MNSILSSTYGVQPVVAQTQCGATRGAGATEAHYESLSWSLWTRGVKRPSSRPWAWSIWLPAPGARINHMQLDTSPSLLPCKHISSFWCSDTTLVFMWHLTPNLINSGGAEVLKTTSTQVIRMNALNVSREIYSAFIKNMKRYKNIFFKQSLICFLHFNHDGNATRLHSGRVLWQGARVDAAGIRLKIEKTSESLVGSLLICQ